MKAHLGRRAIITETVNSKKGASTFPPVVNEGTCKTHGGCVIIVYISMEPLMTRFGEVGRIIYIFSALSLEIDVSVSFNSGVGTHNV